MKSRKQNLILEIRSQIITPTRAPLPPRPWIPANSLLRQFIQALKVQVLQVSHGIIDTSNVSRILLPRAGNLACAAPANTTTYGIQIGTGITAVAMTDYKIETQLTTNIYHNITSGSVENPDANTWSLAITRALDNNTGALVQVTEVALVFRDSWDGWLFCLDRTLYPVDIPIGASLTLTYKVTVTL